LNPTLGPHDKHSRRLLYIFGALYFAQGIAEPTEGLIAQPVRSLLRSWGHDASTIGTFATLLSVPWMVKPLYGIVSDFVPLLGSRRRSWLLLWTFATAVSLTLLWWLPLPRGALATLLVLLLIPTVGIAFTDVVVDALMVEEGQPRGLTGRIQSVQWGMMYGATILTGWLGGVLSARGLQTTGFLICGVAMAGAFFVAWSSVREPDIPRPRGDPSEAARTLVFAAKQPAVRWIALFLFLVNFNPFGTSVSYVHMTETLGLGEALYGQLVSVQAIAAVAATACYGWLCRIVPFRVLLHACVAGSIACTACWLWLADARSAFAIAIVYGFTLMLVGLVQLDLAARWCPPALAATTFAILMSVTNLSAALAEGVGATLYTRWSPSFGGRGAFALLVAVGASCTALAWLLVPALRRLEPR